MAEDRIRRTDLPFLGMLVVLYMAQGLPSGLLAKALPALARDQGMSLPYIGLLAFAAFPWALKFLWAPWVDRLGAGRAGHRKRWILACQLTVALLLASMAFLSPDTLFADTNILWLLMLLCFLNFFCSTQDVATDGLAVRFLRAGMRGIGNSIQVGGYKIGLVIGGGGLLIMLDYFGWRWSLLSIGMLLILLLPVIASYHEPAARSSGGTGKGGWRLVPGTLVSFWRQPGMLWWLAVLLIYKVGDSLGSRMIKPLLVDSHWPLASIGLLDLATSLAGILGALVGGLLLMRWRRASCLMIFGGMHAVAMLAWSMTAAMAEAPLWQYWLVALLEQLADAMATVALFTLMMDHCRRGWEGADYTAQASVQLGFAGMFALASGFSAQWLGYANHFLLAAFLGLVAIMMVSLWRLNVRFVPQAVDHD